MVRGNRFVGTDQDFTSNRRLRMGMQACRSREEDLFFFLRLYTR